MDERATVHLDIYGQGPLARHLIDRINYYRARHNASISAGSSSSSSASTTPLPPNPPADPSSRCRIFSVCVGQLHPHGRPPAATFSLRPHQELTGAGPGRREFLKRIEKQYPTKQSIIDTFGKDLESVVVIGVDPGEVVSGAFCVRLNNDTVVNLLVKRASLC
jgi:hypothetical protein